MVQMVSSAVVAALLSAKGAEHVAQGVPEAIWVAAEEFCRCMHVSHHWKQFCCRPPEIHAVLPGCTGGITTAYIQLAGALLDYSSQVLYCL